MPPNPILTYVYEGYSIILRFRQLVWSASVLDPEGTEVWREGGFRDKELAVKAAKYAVGKILGREESPSSVTIYGKGRRIVGEVENSADAGDAQLRVYSVELVEAMESYEEPEDLFAFLRRRGFTLEG